MDRCDQLLFRDRLRVASVVLTTTVGRFVAAYEATADFMRPTKGRRRRRPAADATDDADDDDDEPDEPPEEDDAVVASDSSAVIIQAARWLAPASCSHSRSNDELAGDPLED